MIKFPSIEQFRNVIHHVKASHRYVGKDGAGQPIYDHTRELPTLKFQGTVKLHGTNAAVVYNVASDSISYQSRERILTLEQDNAGFMAAQSQNAAQWRKDLKHLIGHYITKVDSSQAITKVAVYGEWCGKGIQRGVAICELSKMFVLFAIKLVFEDATTKWLPLEFYTISVPGVHEIDVIGTTWLLDIDFAHPELAQNRMVEITEAVENECPVGRVFGASGVGEGVVWTCVTPGWEGLRFKVKGEKHSASKVKTLAAVDVETIQALKDFVEDTVTEQRLEQGVDNLVREQLKPLDMTSMGDFIRWVYNDVVKEETDTIVASGFDPKKLGGPIANKARPWFIKRINS